jgi:hypothetical protein
VRVLGGGSNPSCELSIDGANSDVTFSEKFSAKKMESFVQKGVLAASELLHFLVRVIYACKEKETCWLREWIRRRTNVGWPMF